VMNFTYQLETYMSTGDVAGCQIAYLGLWLGLLITFTDIIRVSSRPDVAS